MNNFSLTLHTNTIFSGDDNRGGHIQKQPMLHHSFKSRNLFSGSPRVLNRSLEIQIHNVVHVISNIRLPIITQPQLCITPFLFKQLLQPDQIILPTKLHNLNRHCQPAPTKARNKLRVIDNYDKLIRSCFNHLLPKECTTSAFNQVKIRVNFICSIDCKVELRVIVEDR
ncbi:hypothetical protein Hanom_Chr12g01095581 [Helianthus anomalus]